MKKYKKEHSEMKIFEWGDEVNVLDFRVPFIIRDDLERWLSKSEREKLNSPSKKGNTDKKSPINPTERFFSRMISNRLESSYLENLVLEKLHSVNN